MGAFRSDLYGIASQALRNDKLYGIPSHVLRADDLYGISIHSHLPPVFRVGERTRRFLIGV